MHELVYLYGVGAQAKKEGTVPAVLENLGADADIFKKGYDARDAAELGPDKAVRNAESWALYASCEFPQCLCSEPVLD